MDSALGPGPGTTTYFTSLLSKIRNWHPDLPVDPVIVQSLLLCLVAGDSGANTHISSHTSKNLVLRTREEDIGLVLSLTELILTKVFGFYTHKRKVKHNEDVVLKSGELHARSYEHPGSFLRDIFFREKHNYRFSAGSHRKSAHGPHRTSSHPPPSPFVPDNGPPPSATSHSRDGTEESEFDFTSFGSSRRLFITPTSTLRIRPQNPRTKTEPPPETTATGSSHLIPAGRSPKFATRSLCDANLNVSLPKALVISGLEHVGTPGQRALLQTLHDRRLELDAHETRDENGRSWNLPDDFILVYVCAIGLQGRPPVLATLLDRFAMSVDIVVSPAVRQAYVTYRSGTASPLSSSFLSTTPRTPLSPLRPLDTSDFVSHSPSPVLRAMSQTATSTTIAHSSPIIPLQEIAYLRSLTAQAPVAIPAPYQLESNELPDAYTSIHPSLRLYLADLFSATRHHPLLDGTMLTLRAHRDAEDLARAFRVISGNSLGAELVVEVAAMSADARKSVDVDTESGLRTPDDDSSLEWGKTPPEAAADAWLGKELKMSGRKASSARGVEVRVESPRSDCDVQTVENVPLGDMSSSINDLHTGSSTPGVRQPQIWDVSEVDIARIFPRVVSHRVRMRDGPDDEMLGSVMFPAVPIASGASIGGKDDGPSEASEQTVKQVLISILADV